jgi:mono/diheme cytochrome c family protein
MRIIVAGLAAFLLIVGQAHLGAQDEKIQRGQKVYASNRCQMCHSIAGKGNAKGPLDEVGSKLSAEEIREWMINPKEMSAKTKSTRKPPMPNYAKLSKEDLDAVIAYMQSLKKQG